MQKYLGQPDYTYEKMNKASLACGPLAKWAIAQVSYASMLQKVDPLRQELNSNEDEMMINQSKVSYKSNVFTRSDLVTRLEPVG